MSEPKITDTHKDYKKNLTRWKLCRDAFGGTDSIKAGKEAYLPRPWGMEDSDYEAYLKRALWYNALARTVDGMRGLIEAEEAQVEAPGGQNILDDATTEGMPFKSFLDQIVQEVLVVGRYGVFVEYPKALPNVVSQLDAEEAGVRPYAVGIRVEDITNWQYSRVGNKWKLSRVVYKTCGEYDEGEVEYVELMLGASTIEGDISGNTVYVQRKWHQDPNNKQEFVVYDTTTPVMNDKPLTDIPFWFVSVTYGSNEIKKSPVADLADVNVSHYNTQADLEHARFFLGFPQAVLAGFSLPAGTVVAIGSQQILQAPDGNAKWGYLEFTGQGLQSLTDAATQKEDMMAKLGARLLMDDKKVAETAEAARIKASGQACVLAGIANSVSHSMTEVLKFMLQWTGLSLIHI